MEAADGDILMYSDAATELIRDPLPLLALAAKQDVIGFALSHLEKKYTKRDTFTMLDGEKLATTHQVLAGIFHSVQTQSYLTWVCEPVA